jgi:hypothetical protein
MFFQQVLQLRPLGRTVFGDQDLDRGFGAC